MTRRAGLRRFAWGWAGRLALAAAAAAWGFAALAQSTPPKPTKFSVSLVETRAVLQAEVPSGTAVTRWDYRRKIGSDGDWGSWLNIVATNRKLIATVAGLDRGKTYGFQVRAVNNAGEGPESDSKEVSVPAVAPPTPSSFTATAGDRQVTLSASIDTDNGSEITRWQYQRKTGSGGSYGKWKDIDSSKAKTSISTVIAGLTNGTAYGFKIRAENGAGRGGGSESGMVTPSTTPAAPTGLTATAGNGSVALSWTAGGNGGSAITGWKYLKHSSNNWDNDWTAVPNGGASTTSYTVPSLTNGTAYKFKVRAVNDNGDGAASAVSASAMPSAPATASPGKPTVTAVIPIGGCILVRWQPPADDGGSAITGYEIGDPGSGIAHNAASASSREAKWPPAGNNRCSLVDRLTYGMQVRAKIANGDGDWSDEIGVQPTKTGIDVSGITSEAATLSVDNLSKAPWWYKGEQAGAQCKAVAKGTTTASLAGLDANTDYTYAVYYDSDCPSGSKLNSKSFKTLQALPPPKPKKPTVAGGNASVTLASSVANNGGSAITKWKYTKAEKPAGQSNFGNFDSSWTEISSTSLSLSHTVTGLTNGTAYKFKVRAVNALGDGAESDESGEVTPVAPVTLTAGDVTATKAKLAIANWSEAWSYQDGQKGHYISCTNVAAGTAEASLSGLTPGRDYLVYAYGKHNCPVNDNTLPRTLSVIFTTLLHKVEGVSVSAGGGSLSVGWTAQSGVTGYHVQWKTGTEDWSSDRQQDATANSGAISNLTGGATYTVRVRSYHRGYKNRVKYGEWSNPATGTTQAPTQTVTLTASEVTHNSAVLTIANHSGGWHYKYTAPDGGACSSTAVTTASTAVSNLSGNTSYTYKAYSDNGCNTALTAALTITTRPPKPAKPTVASGAGSGKLRLSSSVGGGNAAIEKWQYQQKAADDTDFGSWQDIQSSSKNLSHTVSGLTDGTAYKFKVRAVNATGEGAVSDESDEATPRAPTQPPPDETQPPSVTLTAGGVTHNSATLTIAAHTGNWHYKYTSPAGGACSSTAETTASTAVNGLTANTSYTFSAYSDSNCSTTALATAAAFTTLPPKPARPTVAASGGGLALSSSLQGGEAALTRWEYTKKAGAGNFEANWTVIPSSTSKDLSHTVSGLEGGKSYAFKVRAVNATGAGPESDASDAAALQAAAPAPAEAAHRKRLARIGRALAPEAARALASGAARAVSDRIRAVLSGDAGPPPGQALRAFVEARGEALSDGTASLGEALAGASFSLSAAEGGDAGGGASGAGLWAAGDWRALSGGGRALAWDGGAAALHLGADTGFRRGLLGGLALSVSEAAFDYADRSGEEAVKGEWTARMTGVHPYAARLWEDGSRLWALLGYGAGEVEIDDGAAGRREADGEMATLAAGGALRLSPAEAGRPSLDLVADGFAARFETERSAGLPEAVEAEVSRLRVALAGAAALEAGPGAALAPSAELGLRWDGGDGETGFGAELGAGLSWSRPAAGLRLEAHARALLAHEGGVEEWGAGGLARLDPDARGRGPSLSLRPSFGHAGSGAARLWEEGVAGRGPEDGRPAARLDAEAGYGLAAPGAQGALLTPWAGVGLEDGGARRYGAGLRLERGPDAALGLEAARAGPERALTLTYRIRW